MTALRFPGTASLRTHNGGTTRACIPIMIEVEPQAASFGSGEMPIGLEIDQTFKVDVDTFAFEQITLLVNTFRGSTTTTADAALGIDDTPPGNRWVTAGRERITHAPGPFGGCDDWERYATSPQAYASRYESVEMDDDPRALSEVSLLMGFIGPSPTMRT